MISIIIPTKNEESILGVLLGSLAQQDCAAELEVVVADAFSTDQTRELARSFSNRFHSLLIIDGGFQGVARNKGAKVSSGDILFFIDADMYLPDEKFISKSVRYMRENNLHIAPVYLRPISRKILDKFLVGSYNVIVFLSKYFVRPLGAQCIICTKEAFLGAGGYPEDVIMAEDHDFVFNTSRKYKYGVVPFTIHASVRRFDKEGRWGLVWKYLMSTYHVLFIGPIKKPFFDYEYDYKDVKKK